MPNPRSDFKPPCCLWGSRNQGHARDKPWKPLPLSYERRSREPAPSRSEPPPRTLFPSSESPQFKSNQLGKAEGRGSFKRQLREAIVRLSAVNNSALNSTYTSNLSTLSYALSLSLFLSLSPRREEGGIRKYPDGVDEGRGRSLARRGAMLTR